jgi:hypothetical protein
LPCFLALFGVVGGKWLWEKMSESPVLAEMRKYVKFAGLAGTPALFFVLRSRAKIDQRDSGIGFVGNFLFF